MKPHTKKLFRRGLVIAFIVVCSLVIYMFFISVYHFLDDVDYQYNEAFIYPKTGYCEYYGTITMTTRSAFIPGEKISVKGNLTIPIPENKMRYADSAFQIIFFQSRQHESDPNTELFKKIYSPDGKPSFGVFFKMDDSAHLDKMAFYVNYLDVGKLHLTLDETGNYTGEGEIYYTNPGEFSFMIIGPRYSVQKLAENKVIIGPTTDLMNKRMSDLVLSITLLNIILFIYFEQFRKPSTDNEIPMHKK
jgi:hypothetical protein